jgi:hypothetical protein
VVEMSASIFVVNVMMFLLPQIPLSPPGVFGERHIRHARNLRLGSRSRPL